MRKTLSWLLVGVLTGCGLPGTGGSNGTTGPAGPAGPQGPKGDPGTAGTGGTPGSTTASISAITPATVPGARMATVTISGVGTNFKAGTTTVDLADPGITVSSVNVGSLTNLTVVLNVTPQALIGPHNLTVNTPGAGANGTAEQLVVQSGLNVQATLYSELPMGVNTAPKVPQGGLTTVQLRNLDYRQNPFDPLTVRPAGGITALVGLSATAMPPTPIINATTYGSLVLVDALAPAATGLAMTLSTGTPLGTSVQFVSDAKDMYAPQVLASMPNVLNAGQQVGGQKLLNPVSTVLYKFTTPADNYVTQLSLTGLGTGLLPVVLAPPRIIGNMAPTTGHFADGLPIDTAANISGSMLVGRDAMLYMPKMGDYYFALYTDDLSGSANHTYSIVAKTALGTNLSLKEPAATDSAMLPVATVTLDKIYYALDGAIDFVNDVDYIKFTANVDGRAYATVQTATGAKVSVAFYDSACMAALATPNLTAGAASQEIVVTKSSQYCIKVTGPTVTPYQLQLSQDLP